MFRAVEVDFIVEGPWEPPVSLAILKLFSNVS